MSRRKQIESILVIAAGFALLSFIYKIKWLLFISGGVLLLGISSKHVAQAITWLWFKVGHALGWINSRILLSIIFFLILFPIAAITRAFGKLSLKLNKEEETYYSERNHIYAPEDLKNIW